jgi:hypothetical protein
MAEKIIVSQAEIEITPTTNSALQVTINAPLGTLYVFESFGDDANRDKAINTLRSTLELLGQVGKFE